MMIMELATFTRSDNRSPQSHPIGDMIRGVVLDADRTAPRSLQTAIGPSEVGDPCARRLAYRIMNEPHVNTDSDPWAAIVGTAVHAWLAAAFTAANTRLGRIRWLVEQRLEIMPGLTGSCDLYLVDFATVIDHKVVGATAMTDYKRNRPPDAYRAQAHLYGKGYRRLGLPVHDVALAFFPRGGMLAGLHVWSEPFNEAIADAALNRLWQITEAVVALDVEHHPERYRHIPRVSGHHCTWCSWLRPGSDKGDACPGYLNKAPATLPVVA
jgi:hypothetical protein